MSTATQRTTTEESEKAAANNASLRRALVLSIGAAVLAFVGSVVALLDLRI